MEEGVDVEVYEGAEFEDVAVWDLRGVSEERAEREGKTNRSSLATTSHLYKRVPRSAIYL